MKSPFCRAILNHPLSYRESVEFQTRIKMLFYVRVCCWCGRGVWLFICACCLFGSGECSGVELMNSDLEYRYLGAPSFFLNRTAQKKEKCFLSHETLRTQ